MCVLYGFTHGELWTRSHLYDVDGGVLVVRPHPLVDQDALVELAPKAADQGLHREAGSRPVGGGDRPAPERVQHLLQGRVAYLLNLTWPDHALLDGVYMQEERLSAAAHEISARPKE